MIAQIAAQKWRIFVSIWKSVLKNQIITMVYDAISKKTKIIDGKTRIV